MVLRNADTCSDYRSRRRLPVAKSLLYGGAHASDFRAIASLTCVTTLSLHSYCPNILFFIHIAFRDQILKRPREGNSPFLTMPLQHINIPRRPTPLVGRSIRRQSWDARQTPCWAFLLRRNHHPDGRPYRAAYSGLIQMCALWVRHRPDPLQSSEGP
jgi:hypothetical protein